MSMRLRHLAILRAKALKENETETDSNKSTYEIQEKVDLQPDPVSHIQEEINAESLTENDLEIEQPLVDVVSESEVSEITAEEVVEEEAPKKKTGRKFGKDSA